jgi:hypothetical protein
MKDASMRPQACLFFDIGRKIRSTGLAFCVALSLVVVLPVSAGQSVYDTVRSGRVCRDSTDPPGSMECEYAVGNGLHFLINGVGQPDWGIAFYKSSADSDFYGAFSSRNECIAIYRGRKGLASMESLADEAFVSPKNGTVYRTRQECQAAD